MKYDVRRMYKQARGFQLAGLRCIQIQEDEEQQWLPIQSIVNCAFACEIYLKAILDYDDLNSNGHHLKELYDRLLPKRKSALTNLLCKEYTAEQVERYFLEVNNVFVEYRYIYEMSEDHREHLGFVSDLASALTEIVGKLTQEYVLRMIEGTL